MNGTVMNRQTNRDDLPEICGKEAELEEAMQGTKDRAVTLAESNIAFDRIKSACCVALHMHQPLIPAGGGDLRTADLISNLDAMRNGGDSYNAGIFHYCYKRIGRFVVDLINEGFEPRVMLEYSGTLFYGLKHMGLNDVFDELRPGTCDPHYRRAIEWLGCPWGHAVAPSTPVQDYRLHVKAWQQHFAALFGTEALTRVKGFSPSEMALPNHPDVAYEFLKTLKDCGYEWLLVQEHTVEQPQNGQGPEQRHLPHRLVCQNSKGESVSLVAFIKTQGSDTKLVAQMQPWYEAKGLSRITLATKSIPQVVTQIADGENGGVMMNEFPDKYLEVARAASHGETPLMTGTEYLEHLLAAGIKVEDLPVVQPIKQKSIWDNFKPGDGPERLAKVIEELKRSDHRFHMEGGSWTNNISWVRGYDDVLGPMEKASSLFNEKVLKRGIPTGDSRFKEALFYLLCSQTSCYRYWGQGVWTDYGKEICRRAEEIINSL
jgi:hypothetical protein